MTNNFDNLVARCSAMRRRRMIRLSLFITGTILVVVAFTALIIEWSILSAPQTPIEKPSTTKLQPVSLNSTASSPTDHNDSPVHIAISENTIPKLAATPPSVAPTNEMPIAVVVPPATVPTSEKDFTGNRVFSVQNSTKKTTADFISAYNSNPKYETALIIARDFYAQENYVDAAIWAKKTNQLNREPEEAWLLYAKSYYAQGRKDEAIKILELYLNYKDSKAASELVRTWKLNTAD